jgi:hypothetical protein
MKIGIFGDSFAHSRMDNPTPGWPDILAKKYKVENLSEPGSSLYYSVDLFLRKQVTFDKIIFIATNVGRLTLPTLNTRKKFIPNYHNAVALKEVFKNDTIFLKTLDAAIGYFEYIQNVNYDKLVHNLMLEEVKRVRPDAIVLEAFGSPDFDSMFQIQLKEEIAWNYSPIVSSFNDRRNCHMTVENNAIFAEKVEEWLHGAPVKINLDDFVTPMNKEFYLKNE